MIPDYVNADSIQQDINVSFIYSNTGVTASADGMVIASTEQGWVGDTSGDGFSLDGTSVTIDAAGKYNFSGACNNGNIFVPKGEGQENRKIEINLEGLQLTEPDEGQCPIEIKGGTNRVEISAKKNTQNVLTDANHFETSPKACINASKKLVLKGKGELIVNGNNKNGIKSDTKIEIKNLNLKVNSVGDAIKADEELSIESGKITVSCNDDAIKSDEHVIIGVLSSDAIAEPIINVEKCYEGIEAILVDINNGNIKIRSKDDGINASAPKEYPSDVPKDDIQVNVHGGVLDIIGGNDGIDSNGSISLLGGNITSFSSTMIAWGDAALDCETALNINGATVFTGDINSKLEHYSKPSNESQYYIFRAYQYRRNSIVGISDNGQYCEFVIPFNVNHIFYSSPTLTEAEARNQSRNMDEHQGGGTTIGSGEVTIGEKKSDENTSAEAIPVPVEKIDKVNVSKIISKKKAFTLKLKKQSVDGYKLQYCGTKSFNKNSRKTIHIKKNKTLYTVKNLESNKKYYIRLRSYKVINAKTIYSPWSKTFSVKIK